MWNEIVLTSLTWWAPVVNQVEPMHVAQTVALTDGHLSQVRALSEALGVTADEEEAAVAMASGLPSLGYRPASDKYAAELTMLGHPAEEIWALPDDLYVAFDDGVLGVQARETETEDGWKTSKLDIRGLGAGWEDVRIHVAPLEGTHQAHIVVEPEAGEQGWVMVPYISQRGDDVPGQVRARKVVWLVSAFVVVDDKPDGENCSVPVRSVVK